MRLPAALVLLAACSSPPPPAATTARDTSFLEQYAATNRFRLGEPAAMSVAPDGAVFYFLRSPPRSFVRDLYAFDVATQAERRLLTAEDLLAGAAEQLSPEERARRERLRLSARGIASYELSRDGKRLLVPLSGKLYVVEADTAAVQELIDEGGYPNGARLSPDGRSVACVRRGDLYVIDVDGKTQRRLTRSASPHLQNGLPEFVAQEEMGRQEGLWWSDDSHTLVFQETDTSEVEQLVIADPTHPEAVPEASPYPRPGKQNAKVRLGIVPARGGSVRYFAWDREAYPYLASVIYRAAPLTLVVQNRAQTELVVLRVETTSLQMKQLLRERDPAWLNLDQSVPHFMKDGSFLWAAERDGIPILEQRNPDGSLRRSLTGPGLGYRELLHADEQHAWVSAGLDPTETHVFRLDLLAPGLPLPSERLSHDPGVHRAVVEGGVTVLTSELPTGARRVEVQGPTPATLRSEAEVPSLTPDLIIEAVGSLYAALVKPRGFSPGKKYPVIVHVYGGPGVQLVQKNGRGFWLDQWIADQGFMVVAIDGRGTPNRGREHERAIKGNLTALPLRDQVEGLRTLAEKHPELDLERVGIYGWSFGGTMAALAVMQHPDVFRAAVAGAPVTDWLDYDTHYTERYLGLPAENAQGYSDSSVIPHAGKLGRPLLLIHGTADDNVYFMHSLKLSDALFRAGKPHELLPLVSFTHMVPDPVVTTRLYERVVEFFQHHL